MIFLHKSDLEERIYFRPRPSAKQGPWPGRDINHRCVGICDDEALTAIFNVILTRTQHGGHSYDGKPFSFVIFLESKEAKYESKKTQHYTDRPLYTMFRFSFTQVCKETTILIKLTVYMSLIFQQCNKLYPAFALVHLFINALICLQ